MKNGRIALQICIVLISTFALFVSGCNGNQSSSATPTPTVRPTATVELTASIPMIASAMSPVIDGIGVQEAAVYDPDKPGTHPVVILTKPNGPYLPTAAVQYCVNSACGFPSADWNENLPAGWLPTEVGKTELVLIIGPEREFDLGSAGYAGGLSSCNITRYRYEIDLELREAQTGRLVESYNFRGTDPGDFPSTVSSCQDLEGSHFDYAQLEEWLCPYVTSQNCWKFIEPPLGIMISASPNGKWIGLEGNVDPDYSSFLVWQIDDNTVTSTAEQAYSISTSIFSPDGNFLALAYTDGSIELWQTSDGTLLHTLKGQSDWIRSMAFSPDGQTLMSVKNSDAVELWRTSDGFQLLSLQTTENEINAVSFSSDGQSLILIYVNGIVELRQISSGEPTDSQDFQLATALISPAGQAVVLYTTDGSGQLWQISGGSLVLVKDLQDVIPVEDALRSEEMITFSADGETFALANYSGAAQVWRVSDGKLLGTMQKEYGILSASFSPNGLTMGLGFYGKAGLWRISDNTVQYLKVPESGITEVFFSPDGQSAVTITTISSDYANADYQTIIIQIWDVSNGSLMRTLVSRSFTGDTMRLSAGFSSDGQTLSISSGSSLFGLWQLP